MGKKNYERPMLLGEEYVFCAPLCDSKVKSVSLQNVEVDEWQTIDNQISFD